jgi:hypothetical protein
MQGLEEKSSAPVGDRNPIVQPIVRHYTATAAPNYIVNNTKNEDQFQVRNKEM